MNRSPLTETIKRVEGMITYVRENLSTDEYMLFLDLLAPEPEPEAKPAKKTRKKSASKSASKSSRASGMAAAINRSLSQRRQVKDGACTFVLGNGATCNTGDNNPIHDQSFGYAGYHEFQPAGKLSAPPVRERSSTNGGAENSTVSSGTDKEDAGDAAPEARSEVRA